MSRRIKTGIRKDASFDQNLAGVREAVARYGVETVTDRLREMRQLFYWIKNDPNWQAQIEELISQIEYDAYVLPRLIEEVEINEIVTEGGAFVSRKRKVKVVIDVTKGESHDLKGVLY